VYNTDGKILQIHVSEGPPTVDINENILFVPEHISFHSGEHINSIIEKINNKKYNLDINLKPGIQWEIV